MSEDRLRIEPDPNDAEYLRPLPGVPDLHTIYLAGASVDEVRWDSERQTMIYRVDYTEDVTGEEMLRGREPHSAGCECLLCETGLS